MELKKKIILIAVLTTIFILLQSGSSKAYRNGDIPVDGIQLSPTPVKRMLALSRDESQKEILGIESDIRSAGSSAAVK